MRVLVPAAFVGAVLLSSTALSDDAPVIQPAEKIAASGAAAMTCRPFVREGRVTHTECHTQGEWDSIRKYNQQSLHELQLRSVQGRLHMGVSHGR